jgi:hypothetical protein
VQLVRCCCSKEQRLPASSRISTDKCAGLVQASSWLPSSLLAASVPCLHPQATPCTARPNREFSQRTVTMAPSKLVATSKCHGSKIHAVGPASFDPLQHSCSQGQHDMLLAAVCRPSVVLHRQELFPPHDAILQQQTPTWPGRWDTPARSQADVSCSSWKSQGF